jgi:ABC-type molybdate transport system substrate-binding protein
MPTLARAAADFHAVSRARRVARRTTAGLTHRRRPTYFITADTPTLTALREAGVTDESTARTFAGDSLALVQPAGRGYASGTLFDIYKLRFEHLAVGAEETAVGYYARQALITEGGFKRVEDRLKPFAHTTELLASLSGGGSPLGIIAKSQFVQSDGLELVYWSANGCTRTPPSGGCRLRTRRPT